MSERKRMLLTDDSRMKWADAVTTEVDRELLSQSPGGVLSLAEAHAMALEAAQEQEQAEVTGVLGSAVGPKVRRGQERNLAQLAEVGQMASLTMLEFQEQARRMMAPPLAATIRAARCEQGYTWRAVANLIAHLTGGDWGDNQLMGMALCEAAAKADGEDYMREPWN